MIRHHRGSGRRTTIHRDWSEMYRPVTEGTRTATVTLRRPGGTRGAFDTTTGTYPITATPAYYTGKARIQMVSDSEAKVVTADQQVTTLVYRVMLDHLVSGVEVEDLVTVVAVEPNGDASLISRVLTVDAIVWGSLHWERHLMCVDDLERQSIT